MNKKLKCKEWRKPFAVTFCIFFVMLLIASMHPLVSGAMLGVKFWGVITISLLAWWMMLEVLDEFRN